MTRPICMLALCAIAAFAFAWQGPAPIAAGGDKVDFNFHVRPILSDRCFVCHGPDANRRKAKVRLDTREGAMESGVIVPGKPDESEIIRRITADDDDHMPPRHSNLTLSTEEIDIIRRWVAQGAEFKPHWAFIALPPSVPVPALSDSNWPRNPIDQFVLARLEREKLTPSPAATKEAWIRRATFDLTGLPPSIGEIDAFLADDSGAAFEKVVDRLLASPRFGERMALEWLDVARYADSFGYQADGDMHVWPWRDWVIEAFNSNLPFDKFITWQIAGDLLDNPTRQQRLATAFCRLHRMTNEGGSIAEEFRNEYVSDRVHTFGTAFLGLTLECSRCHDHKFDPITMKDYYGLGAFFNSIDEWGTYNNSHWRPSPTLALPTPQQEKTLAELAKKVESSEAKLHEIKKGREPAFQEWLKRDELKPEIPGQVGYYPLDEIKPNHQLANSADDKAPGSTSAANVVAPGKIGKALKFTGDDPANFPKIAGNLDRAQPFTVAFWLHLAGPMKQAIVFHRTTGTDTGFNGTELSLDDGRLRFALVRYWPGNAIAVRTKTAAPAKEWFHVTVTSDGSGQASGLRIFVNGRPAETETLRDRLTKNTEAGGDGITFGERFRSTGLKDGMIDDLRVFNRALAPIEIAHLHDGKALTEACGRSDPRELRHYYMNAIDPEFAKAREAILKARRELFAAQTGVFEIMTMEEMSHPRPAFVLARGAYDAPKDKPIGRQTPATLPAFPVDAQRDRLGLARWLTHPNHPLTARVAVNRYWQLFFGRGLVATTENFGYQGALPSHPELLDWLARDFIASNWDVKVLCKKIILSSTYRQRSAASAQLRERDRDNVLLARGPSRRLSAEMLRDSALYAGGLLIEKIGGPPTKPYQPTGLWRGQNAFLPEYVPDKGEGLYRRSIYTFWRRTSPPPNMLTFDAPSREVCIVRRQTTMTPLQPLVLLNDPQFVEAARGLAERMLRHGGKLDGQMVFAFRTVTSNNPSPRELALLKDLYSRQLKEFRETPEVAQKYLKIGGKAPAKDLVAAELAAATAVASAVLNLDAAQMTR